MLQEGTRALVTGGGGFIGSHIADALLDKSCCVTVVDNLSTGLEDNVPSSACLAKYDIRDVALRDVFAETRPEVVFHLAAQLDVRRSVADPTFDADVNIVGSLRLLELCREFGTSRFVLSSTGGAIYGEQDAFPAGETHPQRPISPYGVAKLAVENYMHYYNVEHGLQTTALRYGNVYGPRQNPHGEAGVVAIFANKLIAGESATINGDGRQTRDYVYVGDVVSANLLAVERGLLGAYNVGTEKETSVTELFESIRLGLGARTQPSFGPEKPGEQLRSCLSTEKLRAQGWQAKMGLEEGIKATCEFFLKRNQAVGSGT